MKKAILFIIILCISVANAEFKNDSKTKNQSENIGPKIELDQNYPNPFNPETTIKFTIDREEYVTLKLYNIIGQEVREVLAQNLSGGEHILTINLNDLSGGIYFYTLKAGNYSLTKRMTLLK